MTEGAKIGGQVRRKVFVELELHSARIGTKRSS
jgi:hypothetical protein